jgi:hypothetical protein
VTVCDRLPKAYETWLAAQRRVIELVEGAEHPGTPVDRAEGYRWATRLAAIALEWVVEKNDPLRPVVFRQQDEYRKFIVDNPDVNYWFCVLDERQAYRLYGNRGEAPYLGLTFGTDIFHWGQPGAVATGTLAQYHLDQFELGPNGDFEIFLGGPKRNRNWIPLEPGTHHLAIRETFYDKAAQRGAVLRVERLGSAPPPRLMPDELADKLELAASFMTFVAGMCIGMYAGSGANVNRLSGAPGAERVASPGDDVEAHCNTEMVYMGGRWKLAPGEALEIVIRPSAAGDPLYWGLTLVNPWGESYDYRFAQPCTNNHKAVRGADGSWRLAIAVEDPGLARPNWLDTGGRLEGQMLLRWVLTPIPPRPECRVVPVAALRG